MPSKPRAKKAALKTPPQKELAEKVIRAGENRRLDIIPSDVVDEILQNLKFIKGQLDLVNDRDNMASFALAVPGPVPPGTRLKPLDPALPTVATPQRASNATGRSPLQGPVSVTVLSRLFDLEERVAAAHGRLAETDERLARIEAVLGMP